MNHMINLLEMEWSNIVHHRFLSALGEFFTIFDFKNPDFELYRKRYLFPEHSKSIRINTNIVECYHAL